MPISQAALARNLRISSSYLSDIRRGIKRPSVELLMRLRDQLGVSVDWLLTGEGRRASGHCIHSGRLCSAFWIVGLARSVSEGTNVKARAVLALFDKGELRTSDALLGALTTRYPNWIDLEVAVALYNQSANAETEEQFLREVAAGAAAWFAGNGEGAPSNGERMAPDSTAETLPPIDLDDPLAIELAERLTEERSVDHFLRTPDKDAPRDVKFSSRRRRAA
jgi:hypothetical protein